MYALIGGTGFTDPTIFEVDEEVEMDTPYGAPSALLQFGRLRGVECVLLRRHGANHQFAPHRVPYRANLWVLHTAKVEGVIAVATVGGIDSALGAGAIAVPDQVIDYTWGREVTYYDDFSVMGMKHVDMTYPFDEGLRVVLREAAKQISVPIMWGGTYATTQGPRLETAAEIRRFERDGANMVGMTLYPECALARELDLRYAAIAVSVNHAAGVATSQQGIAFEKLGAMIKKGVDAGVSVVSMALERLNRQHN